MLWCVVEACMGSYVFNFERQRAKSYGCGSDIFVFSIFVFRLYRVRMTSADTYAHFCCCILDRYDFVEFSKGFGDFGTV